MLRIRFLLIGLSLSVFGSVLLPQYAYAEIIGFQNDYAPNNWSLALTNSDGYVDTTMTPNSIWLIGGDNQSGLFGNTDYNIEIKCDGTVTFDWIFEGEPITLESDVVISGPAYDPSGYTIGGVFTQLTNDGGTQIQSGSESISVSYGDRFGFRIHSVDNVFGSGKLKITNFNGPSCGCPTVGSHLSATLQPVEIKLNKISGAVKIWRMAYGILPLQFTTVENDPNSYCTLESNLGDMPIQLLPNNVYSYVFDYWTYAKSSASVKLTYYDQLPSSIPQCDFGFFYGVNNNCFLTPVSPNDNVVRWYTDGFTFKITDVYPLGGAWVSNLPLSKNTGPQTFWVSLNKLGIDPSVNNSNLDIVENYIHKKLVNNIHGISKFGIIQDPPANNILITDPNGKQTGISPTGESFNGIPGSVYYVSNTTTAVIIPEPVDGIYKTQVTGITDGEFSVSSTFIHFQEDFQNPTRFETMQTDTIEIGEVKTYEMYSPTVHTNQATGQVTIAGTCGLSFPVGNNVVYGSLTPNSISPQVTLNMTNTGTVPATLQVSGSDWLDGSSNPQMFVNRTHYNVTSGTYSQKAPLQSFDQILTNSFNPATILETFWQMQAILMNPSFTGGTTQTMDFTTSC